MAEPINLNKARKARTRAADKRKAAENRVVHGRSKAETSLSRLEKERAARALDQARRDD